MGGEAGTPVHGATDGEADLLQGGEEDGKVAGSSPLRQEENALVSSSRSPSAAGRDASFRSSGTWSSSSYSLASDVESDDGCDSGYPVTQCEYEEIPSFRWIASPLRWWKPKGKSTGESLPTPKTEGEIILKAFTFNELKSASRNFRPDSLLGEGVFGYVFKGWIDEHTLSASRPGSGMAVAVKQMRPEAFQGHKEWLTEVRYLGKLHHPNLVKLIGYCSEGDNRLLVYEFMPKGSLENHLFRDMFAGCCIYFS